MWVLFAAINRARAVRAGWLLARCALPAIAIFPIVALWSRKAVLFDWAAPGYLMLFPLIGAQ